MEINWLAFTSIAWATFKATQQLSASRNPQPLTISGDQYDAKQSQILFLHALDAGRARNVLARKPGATSGEARHPETMKRMKEMRAKQNLRHASTAEKSGPTALAAR